MRPLLQDSLNLQILKLLCSGVGVGINSTELSKMFGSHRNTIKTKASKLFEHKILDRPFYPFSLFDKLPLVVIEKAEFIRDKKTNTFIEEDPFIWAAFFAKEEAYNTFLIEFHKDIHSYQNWKENIINERKVTLIESSFPSETIFLSAKSLIKYNPSASAKILEKNYKNGYHDQLSGLKMDDFVLNLMTHLLEGKGIRTNESIIARKLDVHRRTVLARIRRLLHEKIILPPVCHFPRVWVPPEYFLVFSLLKIKKKRDLVLRTLKNDPHISVMFNTFWGQYNLAIFSTFYTIEDYLKWSEEYDQRFPECIEAVKNTYLSPAMTFSIAQNYVTLTFLENLIKTIKGEELLELMKGK